MPVATSPEDDPFAFQCQGRWYHMCSLPGHDHGVEYQFTDCNDQFWAGVSEEEKAALKEKARRDTEAYFNGQG